MKIDWKRKLSSRKLWLAVANFVTLIVLAFGYSQAQADRVAAIIMAGASVIAYIIAEGLADSSNSVLYLKADKEEDEDVESEQETDN